MHLSGAECKRTDVTVDDDMKKKIEKEVEETTFFLSSVSIFSMSYAYFNNIILVYYCCALFYPYVAYAIRVFKVYMHYSFFSFVTAEMGRKNEVFFSNVDFSTFLKRFIGTISKMCSILFP